MLIVLMIMTGSLLNHIISQEITSDDYAVEIAEAERTIKEFIKIDQGLHKFFDQAYGYAILPKIGKGGFIVGGAHGDGILFENGEPVGTIEMTQLTVGGQIGGKSYAEIIFFKTGCGNHHGPQPERT